jgi:heterotetrameric sarcosine oxidase gamma subunit
MTATLVDLGSPAAWSVGGRRVHHALAAAGQPARVGAMLPGPLGETWGVAPDEVLLVAAGAGAPDAATTLRSAGALVTSIGAGLVQLRLSGIGAGSVLEAACQVDLSDRALKPGSLAQVSLSGIRAIVVREGESVPSYRIAVQRDLAVSLREALAHLGAQEHAA